MIIGQNLSKVIDSSRLLKDDIQDIQLRHEGFPWYPYASMANFDHFRPLLTNSDHLFEGSKRICDIGAADGHVGFSFERAGHTVDIYDYGPTNFNGLRGARLLKQQLGSSINIYEKDLDSNFHLEGEYDFAIFLGILYHLKNPYYALEQLGKHCRNMIVSTRVCRHFYKGGPDVSGVSAAYLLNPDESNNDATNYWIFTRASLERIFYRTGWKVVAGYTVGDTFASNPQDDRADERYMGVLTRI
jgi:tRNA (mo5U34)-methyltransferase